MIILSYTDKVTNKTSVGKIDDSHFLEDKMCIACTKNLSTHKTKKTTEFKTNHDFFSFKLIIENEKSKTILATKGINSMIGIFSDECLPALSEYKVGFIYKKSKDSKETSFIRKKADKEYSHYPKEKLDLPTCTIIEQMISKGIIKKKVIFLNQLPLFFSVAAKK